MPDQRSRMREAFSYMVLRQVVALNLNRTERRLAVNRMSYSSEI